jgi:hypothetical protein
VEQVFDRVPMIAGGRLVEEGPPATLGAARRRIRVHVTAAAGRLLARWSARHLGGGQFLVRAPQWDVNAALAVGRVIAESVTVELSRLEDGVPGDPRGAGRACGGC